MRDLDNATWGILDCSMKPIGTLKINESFVISVYTKMPNRFHRMMAKILLGWEYKEVKEEVYEDD